MKQTAKYFYLFMIVVVILWQLPWIYNFLTTNKERTPFTLYSSVIGNFATITHDADKGTIRKDFAGNQYTEEEFDSILPCFFVKQLLQDGRFPKEINNTQVRPRRIHLENFAFRITPNSVVKPEIGLHYLIESYSKRVKLEMPDDAFRINDKGIEFIDIKTNTVNKAKSKLFTETMKKKGFQFPAIELNSNPSTHKEYDDGFVLLDANHQLYQLKRMKNRPYIRKIETPKNITLKHLFIAEFNSRRYLNFMTDTNHKLYVVNRSNYKVSKIDIPSYNPEKDEIVVFGNYFDWTIKVGKEDGEYIYAIDARDNFKCIKQHKYSYHHYYLGGLHFSNYTDKYIKPRFSL